MRRLAAAILAMPVIASIYVATLLANPGARRSLAAVGATMLVAIVGIGLVSPAPAASKPPSTPSAVPDARFTPVETDGGGAPANASGAAAPTAAMVATVLDAQATSATNSGTAAGTAPVTALVPTPAPGSTMGQATAAGVTPNAAIRIATTAEITGSQPTGKRIRPTSAFVLRFNRAVTLTAVKAALTITPAIKGTLKALSTKVYQFTPAAPLTPNTAYTISLTKPIRDGDGIVVSARKPMRLLTAAVPALVRFRPAKGLTSVDPTQAISVRFTLPMNHVTTQNAFQVVISGRRIAGHMTWAEKDTVLVFTPVKPLPKGAGVGIRLLGTATSADGVQIRKGGSATFTVIPGPKAGATVTTARARPTAKPVARPGGGNAPPPKPRSGGGSLGDGAWAAAEAYYLTLMNCTRTGGYVTSSGHCSSPGGRNVAPLWIDQGISANVSRPYARYLATTGICSHFADGNPGTRLRRAGYDSYRWAENISCPQNMNVMALMVYTQQYFQAEGWSGGHYINLMNAEYDRVGIGVWVANGRAEVVIDFYHP